MYLNNLYNFYNSVGIYQKFQAWIVEPVLKNPFVLGIVFLFINLVVSAGAQLLLKSGMIDLGSFQFSGEIVDYVLGMLTWKIVGGLFLYASGIAFWLLCLSKLELSFAYPASTVQYVMIFVGSWFFFNEDIGLQRIIGMLVICLGVVIISLDHTKK